jgi:hypothetical protein
MVKARKTISTVLSLTMAGVVSTSPPTHAEGQTFKSGVEMVALTVTVTNAAGHCVTGLTERDFVVYEEGIPQTVSLFGAHEVLADVALVLDTSSSMGVDLLLVKRAAEASSASSGPAIVPPSSRSRTRLPCRSRSRRTTTKLPRP